MLSRVGRLLATGGSERRNHMALDQDQLTSVVDRVTIPGVPKTISPGRHAMLDYGVAFTFFSLAAKYWGRHKAAAALAAINGGMVLGVSLCTDYPGGLWRKIPFPVHGALDIVQAATAGLGPVLMGFGGDPEARSFYGQAMSEVGVIAATDWHAQERKAHAA